MMTGLDTLRRCRDAVSDLAAKWELAERNERWRAIRWAGQTAATTVHLEDVSAIPFVAGIPGVEAYQHRSRVRASDSDIYVCVSEPAEGYEEYCTAHLGLGAPRFLHAPAHDNPCAVARAASQGAAFEALAKVARRQRSIALHPYMAIEDVWALGHKLHQSTGADVRVIGPPPATTWVANDKAMFAAVVAATAGEPFLVDTRCETTVEGLADALMSMAKRYPALGLKRTRCASAMGNKVLQSHDLRSRSPAEIRTLVTRFLDDTEWPGDEEVLVVEWVQTDISPSTQLWLPPSGPPLCQGIYEQLLEGEERCFLGSRPSALPAQVNEELALRSLEVAAGLQAMGYVGRCSFDFVVAGDPHTDFEIKFTECNGRWGGTSTPMHLVDRLVSGPRPTYLAQDWMEPRFRGLPFETLRDALEPELFDPRTQKGRFILYNVNPLERTGKFDVIGFGKDDDDAWHGVRERLPQLLNDI